jgi:GH15 family glucan-1,4-alpha-glucosidase
MPIDRPHVVSDRRRIVRAVRGIRGEVEFEASVEPRFDYGRRSHRLQVDGTTAVFEAGDQRLQLTSVAVLERDGDDVRSRFTVRAGDTSGFLLESGASGSPQRIGGGEVMRLFLDTVAYWRRWLEQSSYQGRWREAVERSAITLKLMTYAPSGDLVAAPTAGLPEQVGGSRNWDYRYTWVRDGAFSLFALLGLGFTEEATAFGEWLRARVDEHAGEGSGPLKIMYRIDGSSELTEETLDHLDGYMGDPATSRRRSWDTSTDRERAMMRPSVSRSSCRSCRADGPHISSQSSSPGSSHDIEPPGDGRPTSGAVSRGGGSW